MCSHIYCCLISDIPIGIHVILSFFSGQISSSHTFRSCSSWSRKFSMLTNSISELCFIHLYTTDNGNMTCLCVKPGICLHFADGTLKASIYSWRSSFLFFTLGTKEVWNTSNISTLPIVLKEAFGWICKYVLHPFLTHFQDCNLATHVTWNV